MTRILSLLLAYALTGCTIERDGQEAQSDTTDSLTALYGPADTLTAPDEPEDTAFDSDPADSVAASSDTTYRIDRVVVPAPVRPPGSSLETARLLPAEHDGGRSSILR